MFLAVISWKQRLPHGGVDFEINVLESNPSTVNRIYTYSDSMEFLSLENKILPML